MDAQTEKKLKAHGELSNVVHVLVATFGQKEAAKMLRAAAKMVAPEKVGE